MKEDWKIENYELSGENGEGTSSGELGERQGGKKGKTIGAF